MQTLILDAAGREFALRVMKVYSSVNYSRGREIVAELFLKSAVEAGRLAALVTECAAEERRAAARKASDAIDKTMFYLDLLQESGVYSERRIKPVEELAREISNALSAYIYGRGTVVSSGDGFDDDYIE